MTLILTWKESEPFLSADWFAFNFHHEASLSLSVSLCPLPLGKNGFFMSDVRACKSRIKTEPELNLQDQPRTLLKFRSEFFCIQGVRFLLSTPPPIPSK